MTPLFPPATVPHPHQHAADAPSPGGDTWEDKEEGGNIKEYFPKMILDGESVFGDNKLKWIGVCPDRRWASAKAGAFRFSGKDFQAAIGERPPKLRRDHIERAIWLTRS